LTIAATFIIIIIVSAILTNKNTTVTTADGGAVFASFVSTEVAGGILFGGDGFFADLTGGHCLGV